VLERLAGAVLLAAFATAAFAASIYVTSIARDEAQVIVNRTAVRTLRIGETSPEGVKPRAIRDGAAQFESGGRVIALRLGQSTMAETTLRADGNGHFVVDALINGVPLRSLIDTGATRVAINVNHARRLGIDYLAGRRSIMQTANGLAPVQEITLASVQVGEIALANVPAVVILGGAERLGVVLIGMSFLGQVSMQRSGDTMSLSRPHLQ
jgi:aspartyl protease family protein